MTKQDQLRVGGCGGEAAPSLAAVTSLVRRAMTRQAASCWYSAWDNSWRVVCSCWRRVKLCSMTASWEGKCHCEGTAGRVHGLDQRQRPKQYLSDHKHAGSHCQALLHLNTGHTDRRRNQPCPTPSPLTDRQIADVMSPTHQKVITLLLLSDCPHWGRHCTRQPLKMVHSFIHILKHLLCTRRDVWCYIPTNKTNL